MITCLMKWGKTQIGRGRASFHASKNIIWVSCIIHEICVMMLTLDIAVILSSMNMISCTLFEKSNFCRKKINFDKTLQFFSGNQSCQQLKKSKTTTFSRFFHPKKINNFLGKSKLNFWTKNEDFEQCGILATMYPKQNYWLIQHGTS